MNATRIKGKICITTTFDRNYAEGGRTLFQSIRNHTDCAGVDFKVITADPEVVRQFGVENCHVMTEALRANYANVKYIKELPVERYSASWYRYEIFNFKGYDRVICIDSDCLCLSDLSYLFSEELNAYDLVSVEDHIVSKVFPKMLDALRASGSIHSLQQRWRDGQIDVQPALLVANKSVVNETWYGRLIYHANTTSFTYSIDEGILNEFIYRHGWKIKLLPLEYDYQDLYEMQCPEIPVPANPIIVHCEQSKPFKHSKASLDPRLHKWHDLWWQERKQAESGQGQPARAPAPLLLDGLAIKHQADKGSRYHNFAVKYDRVLQAERDSFTSVLEIGVGGGQSMKMWADYFPRAIIHGADISLASQNCQAYCGRIQLHLIDQSKRDQLQKLAAFAPFDLILDDGNHFWNEQILSFNTLFPMVKPGGLYIIEDTCTSYWPEYGNHPVSCVEYFKRLVDQVNLNGARGKVPANPPPEFGSWEKGWHRREDCHDNLPAFESIHFFNSLIVIYKR